jgi:hypothetical protein
LSSKRKKANPIVRGRVLREKIQAWVIKCSSRTLGVAADETMSLGF